MCLDVSTGGELHVALVGRRPRRTSGPPRQQQVATTSWPPPSTPAWAGSSSTPSTRSTASSGWCTGSDRSGRGPAPRCWSGSPPGVEVHTHEFVRTGQDDSKFGFGLASGAAADAVDRLTELADRGVVDFVGIHAHLGQPGLRPGSVRPGHRSAGPRSSRRSVCPSWWSAEASACPTSTGRRRRPWPSGPPRCRQACRRGRHPRSVRVTAEPGRSIVAVGGHHPLPGGNRQGRPRAPHLRVGRRGDERQPPAGALRQRLRGLPAPRSTGAPRPLAGPGGGQALRDGRRGGVRRASCPRTWPSATSWPPRSPVPTGTRWPPTTTRCPDRRSSSCADGDARVVVRRETLDDLVRLDL